MTYTWLNVVTLGVLVTVGVSLGAGVGGTGVSLGGRGVAAGVSLDGKVGTAVVVGVLLDGMVGTAVAPGVMEGVAVAVDGMQAVLARSARNKTKSAIKRRFKLLLFFQRKCARSTCANNSGAEAMALCSWPSNNAVL